MMYTLSPQRKKEMIERASRLIVDNEIEDLAEWWLHSLMPAGNFLGQMSYLVSFPWATALFGKSGSDYTVLLGLNWKETAESILQRVDELKKQRDIQREKEKLLTPRTPLTVKGFLKSTIRFIFPTTFVRWLWNKVSSRFKKK